ncbi:MAG TPA: sigma 54-interacting transcriptional regulator [Methylococcus sp.]|nr:sigma 54-interacting transcriptional regulator [Methylococcus sp.]
MGNTTFSHLTPIDFLQTFVIELMDACEAAGLTQAEQVVERIARCAGRFFEEAFRSEYGFDQALDRERYADLIIGLKNKIGGNFSLVSSTPDCIRVASTRCPFGDGVKNSPKLCRMTSSVFGGIAARNFGYAKVVLEKRIALNHEGCEVAIYLDRESARDREGIEYREAPEATEESRRLGELQARIEERLHQLWCQLHAQRTALPEIERPTIVAKSPAMRQVLQAIATVAPTPATVLIRGETGVGKELVARAIHAMSERAHQPFIAVNCGAIPEGLVESVLFGHEKGAFTGAIEVHQGYFERADGGTLFLDEVDSLTPAVQTRLLRILQEGELERVGGRRTLTVDTRIVAATNCDLEKAVAAGSFRKDLYYRLNVVKLAIPPLAQRPEDIPYLVDLILKRLATRYRKTIHGVSPEVMARLRSYDWPGNVRELENTLERAVLFAQGPEISEVDLEADPDLPLERGWRAIRKQTLENLERTYLEQALQRFQGDVSQVAEWMGLTPRAVYLKLHEFGIHPSQFRSSRNGNRG